MAVTFGLSGCNLLQGTATATPATPELSGLCVYDNATVVSQSKLGQAANKRLQHLAAQVNAQEQKNNAELKSQAAKVQKAAKHDEKDTHKKKQKALQQKAVAYRQQAQQLNARLRYTQSVVKNQINKTINPVVNAVYKKQGCGILIKRSAVIGNTKAADLTADVLTALNQKVTTVNFNLLALPQPKQADSTAPPKE